MIKLFLLCLDCCFNKIEEQRVRMKNRAAVFGVELCADIPFQCWYFNNFNQIIVGIDTYALHAGVVELLAVAVVELVTVPVSFLYNFLSVCLRYKASFFQHAVIGPKPHGSTQIGNVLLFFHQVDDVVLGCLVHFKAVGIGITQNVPCKFNNHHLHSQANAKSRNVVLTAVLRSLYFAFNAPLSESRTYNNAVNVFEIFFRSALFYFLAVDEYCLYFVVVICAGLRQRFQNTLVGILQIVFANQANTYFFSCLVSAVQK